MCCCSKVEILKEDERYVEVIYVAIKAGCSCLDSDNRHCLNLVIIGLCSYPLYPKVALWQCGDYGTDQTLNVPAAIRHAVV
jgi:hypothetical protein